MHFEYFKIFSDLVQKKSFSEAAKANGITQSAVSQQLRTIEKHFNAQLVDRSQKQFRLTQEGEKIYKDSQEILRLYDKLKQEINELGSMVSGTLTLASTYSVGIHTIPIYIKSFIESYPTVNIRLNYLSSTQVYDAVINNTADVGFVAYPQTNKLVEVETFMQEELVLVCGSEHKFARRKTIQIKELEGQDLISFESPTPSHKSVMALLKEAAVSVKIARQFDNIEMIKHAVEINRGLAILPISSVRDAAEKNLLKLIQFKNTAYKRSIGVVTRKGKILPVSVRKFIDLVVQK